MRSAALATQGGGMGGALTRDPFGVLPKPRLAGEHEARLLEALRGLDDDAVKEPAVVDVLIELRLEIHAAHVDLLDLAEFVLARKHEGDLGSPGEHRAVLDVVLVTRSLHHEGGCNI